MHSNMTTGQEISKPLEINNLGQVLPIGMRTAVHRIINARQVSKQDRADSDQVMMSKDKWIVVRDIISRRGDGRILMEEGRFVRVSGTRQRHDSTEKMGRKMKREADHKRRRRRGGISEKRWQKRRNRKGACRRTRKIGKAMTNTERRRRTIRDLEERAVIQRRKSERKENMVEGSRMTSRRWTRSKTE